MATLSRKTLGIAITCMESWSHATISHFLYELDVPDEIIVGDSKKRILLNIFRELERTENSELLKEIVFESLSRLNSNNREWLKEALLRDGFVVDGETMAEDVPAAEDTRTSLQILIDRNTESLDINILNHHLAENIELFRQEKWDSSISHARNFVEQLLVDIATAMANKNADEPDLSRAVRVREYLEQVGFLDKAERKKLVDGVYGYFSEEGSHPGISEQSAARVCMHILWAFSFYILEKFEDWKERNG